MTKGFVPIPIIIILGSIILVAGSFAVSKIELIDKSVPTLEKKPDENFDDLPPKINQPSNVSPTPAAPLPTEASTQKSSPAAIKQETTSPQPKASFRLDSITPTIPSPEQMVILKGTGFGSNYKALVFYLPDGSTKEAGPYNWVNNEIKLFLPKELPNEQTLQVAVKRTDDKISNKLTFKIAPNSPESATFQCDSPKNLQAAAQNSTQIKLFWEGVNNVKEYRVKMSDFYQGNWYGFYYSNDAYPGKGITQTSVAISDLKPNTYYSFVVDAECNNGIISKFSNQATLQTLN